MQVLWKAYFRILQFAGLFAPTWRVVFDNLANYVRESKWDDIAASALENAGFRNITIEYYTAGTAATISAEKP
jgi:ubiquinone/menaquinone biosynthesis C-methylase UbiE